MRRPPRTTAPPRPPAADLARPRRRAASRPRTATLAAKDPRVVDLDIIRITRRPARRRRRSRDGDHVATAELFNARPTTPPRPARPSEAIDQYRQLVTEFPDSEFAPVALFNIAAIHDGRGDPDATIATLRELVTTYPESRESIDGHLYIAALQADHEQWADAVADARRASSRART